MKKSSFAALILGTIGGVFFALGMCMSLLPEWGMRGQGTAAGVIGLAVLLIAVLVWRRMEGKAPIRLSAKTVIATIVGIMGALLLGVGMCFCMVWQRMLPGMLIGVVGIVLLVCLIPLLKGVKGGQPC